MAEVETAVVVVDLGRQETDTVAEGNCCIVVSEAFVRIVLTRLKCYTY